MYVFLLLIYLGTGVDRKLVDANITFARLEDCNSHASAIVKRYSTHGISLQDRAVAYCVPQLIDKNEAPASN